MIFCDGLVSPNKIPTFSLFHCKLFLILIPVKRRYEKFVINSIIGGDLN